ncbi:MAG TPA: hypothetical protein ENK24_07405 [Anaerolineae bacterium]|nr:hypothetical protein [Anaerolineae bacterium]
MKLFPKQKMLALLLLLLLLSLACNLPYGIGMKQPGEIAAAATSSKDTDKKDKDNPTPPLPVGTPTPPPTATYLPTFTPTNTPAPTATATRVVVPSSTPIFPVSTQSVPVEGTVVYVTIDGTVVPVTLPSSKPSGPAAPPDNVFVNGSFDDPWPDNLPVAPGWTPFDNEKAHFGWYKDNWSKVVYDGAQAQLIEIINDQEEGDRVAGIYQTVSVIPGAEYELVIHGLLRSDEGSEGLSGNGYALQYAIDFSGGDDWRNIGDNWTTLPLPEHPREDPDAKNVYTYGAHTIRFRPSGSRLTLFIRGWKRWPDLNEANFDVDAISLHGLGCPRAVASLPQATATPVVIMPLPTASPQSAVCNCSGNIYDCANFGNQASAQACYNYCQQQGVGDIHQLDLDYDGKACEDLP